MKYYMRGFNLIELMIAVAIIGILAAIAYPTYQDNMQSARRSDGQVFLLDVMARQERYFSENNSYTTDLTKLGLGVAIDAASPDGHYKLKAEACGTDIKLCVNLTATPQGVQASDTKCAALSYNSQGAKGKSGSGSVEQCW